jgi:predicted dehydrogenase
VHDAHLPAYRLAGFEVAGIFDVNRDKSAALATKFGIPRVYETLTSAVASAPEGAIFDVAVPARALGGVLPQLPPGAPVLIQKPFGEDLAQARALLSVCHERQLRAAVNFQLRHAPCIHKARTMIAAGAIGELHDFEVRVTVYMPWHLWTFLEGIPRVEILYHSVHYIDLARSFLGEPKGVYAKTVKHPGTARLASTRTNIALDYGDVLRANITTNHGHGFGRKHQESYVKWEGTGGALKAKLGLLLDYPHGEPDTLEYCPLGEGDRPNAWESIPVDGNWYPHAFIGSMGSLMDHVADPSRELPTRVEDALRTMAVVEAAYESSARGATPISFS